MLLLLQLGVMWFRPSKRAGQRLPEPSNLAHVRVSLATTTPLFTGMMRLRDYAFELLRAPLKGGGIVSLIIGRGVRVGGGMGRNDVVQLNGAAGSADIVVLS